MPVISWSFPTNEVARRAGFQNVFRFHASPPKYRRSPLHSTHRPRLFLRQGEQKVSPFETTKEVSSNLGAGQAERFVALGLLISRPVASGPKTLIGGRLWSFSYH